MQLNQPCEALVTTLHQPHGQPKFDTIMSSQRGRLAALGREKVSQAHKAMEKNKQTSRSTDNAVDQTPSLHTVG